MWPRPLRAHDDWIIFACRLIFMSTRHHSFRWLIGNKKKNNVYKYSFKFDPLFTQLHGWFFYLPRVLLPFAIFITCPFPICLLPSLSLFHSAARSINDNHFAMIYMTKIFEIPIVSFFVAILIPPVWFIMVIYCLRGSTFQQRKKSTLVAACAYKFRMCVCVYFGMFAFFVESLHFPVHRKSSSSSLWAKMPGHKSTHI